MCLVMEECSVSCNGGVSVSCDGGVSVSCDGGVQCVL